MLFPLDSELPTLSLIRKGMSACMKNVAIYGHLLFTLLRQYSRPTIKVLLLLPWALVHTNVKISEFTLQMCTLGNFPSYFQMVLNYGKCYHLSVTSKNGFSATINGIWPAGALV